MRYIEVTHTYVLPVPEEDTDPAEMDPVMNAGVSMMEKFIRQHGAAIMDLRSDWKMMPKEYGEQVLEYNKALDQEDVTITPALQMTREKLIEINESRPGMEPGQVSFVGDVMDQQPKIAHPWEQGLRVLPYDHELAAEETDALRVEGMLCPITHDHDSNLECIGVKYHPGDHVWQPKRVPKEITDGNE